MKLSATSPPLSLGRAGIDRLRVVKTHRVSSVSFFNSTPLVYGLNNDANIDLRFGVPSSLLNGLVSGQTDVALLPVIDHQRGHGLRIIPAGGIGCDGPTLTVRLFSRRPLEQTTRLAADTDSHTSVALARIIFRKVFAKTVAHVPLTEAGDDPTEARLLIGDKVITHPPSGFEHQLDLGEAWKQLTGMPFVFAIWTARAEVDLGDLPARLGRAREEGLQHVDQLVQTEAVPRGWPAQIARRYLTEYLKFEIADRQLDAIRMFHRLAWDVGALDQPPEPLRIVAG